MMLASSDLAFRRNAAALVILRVEGRKLHVDGEVEVVPKGGALVPSVVCTRFVAEACRYGSERFAGDVYYRDTALEYTRDAGLAWVDIPNAPEAKASAYTYVRTLLRERRVRFHRTPRLCEQLAGVRVQYLSGGRLSVTYDDDAVQDGRHGDLVSAFVGGAAILRPQIESRGAEPLLGDSYSVLRSPDAGVARALF